MPSTTTLPRGRRVRPAAVSLLAVAAAAVTGASFGPQTPRAAVWYASLRKPRATPPGPVIGAVWITLEGLLAFGGYRLLRAPSTPARQTALACWALTLTGLAGYPAIFFGRRKLGAGALAATGMFGASVGLLGATSRVDREAAAAFVPLSVWLGLATALSEELWRKNRL